MTVEESLEGFLIWCAGCNEPIFWDVYNRCHECMVPHNPEEGYCDSCWHDTKDVWYGKYDLDGKSQKNPLLKFTKTAIENLL